MSVNPSLRWKGTSEKGPVRGRNEDAFALISEAGVAAVADGVGGGPGGCRASRIAADAVVEALAGAPWPDPTGEVRRASIRAAHRAVTDAWRRDPTLRGMATTLTAIRWRENRIEGVHVGDSRAYRLNEVGLEPLTRDHTPAGEYLARHGGDRDILRTHPQRHLLLQVVGGDEWPPEPDLFEIDPTDPGTVLVLCSDGVDAVLTEDRLRELLEPAVQGRLEAALEAVVEEALQLGSPDNVTILLAASERGGSKPP